MKVIFLKDMPGQAKKFDVKNVSDGHALNFLLPQGLAQVATDSFVKKVEALKAAEAEVKRKEEAELVQRLQLLESVTITLTGKANEKGHLFAGINKEMLAPEIKKTINADIPAEFIKLEKPLKEVGDHVVEVKVAGKTAKFKVTIKAA